MSKIIVSFRRVYEIPMDEIADYINAHGLIHNDETVFVVAKVLAKAIFYDELPFLSSYNDDFSSHITEKKT
jgi:hypothetical protein